MGERGQANIHNGEGSNYAPSDHPYYTYRIVCRVSGLAGCRAVRVGRSVGRIEAMSFGGIGVVRRLVTKLDGVDTSHEITEQEARREDKAGRSKIVPGPG